MSRSGIRWGPALAAALLVVGGLAIAPLLTSDAETVALAGPSATGRIPGSTRVFARVEGVEGESKDADHLGWIDVLSIDWGAHLPRSKSGKVRRRGGAVVHDVALTMEYDKAAPKLQEMCLKGQALASVDIDMSASFGSAPVGFSQHELKNLLVTGFDVNASGNDESPPSVILSLIFEQITVTYTEYDGRGVPIGDVGYEFDVD